MITMQQALHKAEEQFSQLIEMVEQAIENGWRIDELERSSFAQFMAIGNQLLTAFVAGQGDGNEGQQVEHKSSSMYRWTRGWDCRRARFPISWRIGWSGCA